jgi:hypothetical protein
MRLSIRLTNQMRLSIRLTNQMRLFIRLTNQMRLFIRLTNQVVTVAVVEVTSEPVLPLVPFSTMKRTANKVWVRMTIS